MYKNQNYTNKTYSNEKSKKMNSIRMKSIQIENRRERKTIFKVNGLFNKTKQKAHPTK